MPFQDAGSLIAWIIESGGAGIVSYWVFAQLDKSSAVVSGWPKEWKRTAAIALAIVIGALVALLGGLIGVYHQPQGAADWANLMVSVGIAAGVSGQLTHGFRSARGAG